MRVERDRVGPVETGEQVPGRRSRRGGKAVGSVDVKPDSGRCADIRERVDRIAGAGQRGSGGRDDRDGGTARGTIRGDRGLDRLGNEASICVDRQRSHVPRADPQKLGSPFDRVVRLVRAVQRRRHASEPVPPRPRDGTLAGRRERRHVRHGAATRERPRTGREADELGDPADRLLLDLGRRSGPDREVRVEARREQIAEHANLEPGRGNEREVARTRLCDRLVQSPACVLEHLQHGRGRLGQRRGEQRSQVRPDRRLLRVAPRRSCSTPRRRSRRHCAARLREVRRGGGSRRAA